MQGLMWSFRWSRVARLTQRCLVILLFPGQTGWKVLPIRLAATGLTYTPNPPVSRLTPLSVLSRENV